MKDVAKQFEVSGSYLSRVCAALNVPRPGRGYWAKLSVGKAPPLEPLPEARPGDQLSWSKGGELVPTPRAYRLPKRRPRPRRSVASDETHALIRGAKTQLENSRPIDDGAYLRPYKRLLVDVTASKACLDKALEFANGHFNTFEAMGHRVILAPSKEGLRRVEIDEHEVRSRQYHQRYPRLWSPYRPTVAYVGNVPIGLTITEMSEEVLLRYVNGKYIRDTDYVPRRPSRRYADHTWTTTKELPSGRIRLTAYCPYWRVNWSREWQESQRNSLSSSLKSIVNSVENAADNLIAKLEEADRQAEIEHQRWLAAEEKRRQQEDRRRVVQSIQDSQEHLTQIIQQWSNVMNIERFLFGVARRVTELPESDSALMQERLKRAREFLGTQDPLDFLLAWKTPGERYDPIYQSDESWKKL